MPTNRTSFSTHRSDTVVHAASYMSDFPASPHLFTVCQTGAEPALKKEILREHPELRFAYSRPGFVTFKRADSSTIPADFELSSVFSRAYGLSFGKTSPADLSALTEFARQLARMLPRGRKLRLHLWERDQHIPGDEPLGFVSGQWAKAAQTALDSALGPEKNKLFHPETEPVPEDLVFDLIAVAEDEWWFGYHIHSPVHSRAPGGNPRTQIPDDSPSRAYAKLEDALYWSGAPVRPGDIAVEIGSAPGGASYALLRRGVRVVGIDPGEMAPVVLKFKDDQGKPAFYHVKMPVAQVPREELPESIQWLLLDMNVEPRISLFAVDRLQSRMKDSLLGLILTVKLNKWKIADEIPGMIEHLRAMGMVRVRATQLAANRQEITFVGLTRKGLMQR